MSEPPKYEPPKILDGACHIGDPIIGPQIPYLPGVGIPAPGTLPMYPPGTYPTVPLTPSVSLTLTIGDLQTIIRSEVSSILDEKFSEWEERFKAIK